MANCTHENEWLMGTADGIVCRRCGAFFKSFAELNPAPPVEEKKPEKPKRTRKAKSAE